MNQTYSSNMAAEQIAKLQTNETYYGSIAVGVPAEF